jgi:multidrug efflux pump subunit AcrB
MDSGTAKLRGPIAWMAGNSVAANLAMFVLIVGGLITAARIKKEVFPDFTLDTVTVSVSYPGASPEEVERGIILVVEENIRGIEGVKEVTSKGTEGRATISAELLEGSDAQKVYQDIQQEVDRITTFPEDAEKPTVEVAARRRGVLDLALYGDVPEKTLREQAELIRDRLLLDENITQVELTGVRDLEITISVSREALRKYGLTLSDVSNRIGNLALELPGGGIKTASGEILLRIKERRDYGEEFAKLPIITAADGTLVRLGDIAEVNDGFDEDADEFASWDGKPAVMIDIYRVGDQTPIAVSDAAMTLVEQLNLELPEGLALVVRRDMSDIYRQRLHLLAKNGLIGLTLVIVVLGLFLEARLAFWVMMGIPISFLGGICLMPFFGGSINIISMFAFLISLGIVVDDAIVVGENVYEHRQKGDSFLTAAIQGTREVAMPVTFSVLTNIVTFLPLMFLPGVIGKIWFFIPIVVVSVFSISLLECVFVLPAHLGHARRTARTAVGRWLHARQQAFSRFFMRSVRIVYGPVLELCLRNRYIVTALGTAILILTFGYVNSKRIGIVPMMAVESDFSTVTAVLPYGSPVERTMAVRDQLIAAAQRVAEQHGGETLMRGVYAEVGARHRDLAGSHVVQVRAYLTPPEERPIPTTKFTDYWRAETGPMAGLETILFEADRGGPGSGASLSIQLYHSNSETLHQASSELAARLEEFSNVSDVDDGFSEGKPQLDFQMRPEGLALGLTAANVARQVRNAFYGAEALRQQRGRNEVKVKVRLPRSERLSEHDLDEFLVRTPEGIDVPLRDVAVATRGRAYTSIDRKNGQRSVEVTANVTPRSDSENVLGDVLRDMLPELKQKYPGLAQGFGGRQKDLREGMSSLMLGFAVAIFAIYALLAIPFRSYAQPLIIMVCIPFGIVGAVIAHAVMGYPLSMISMMGIVALSGVVVNDSLVLIDFANGERKRGLNLHDAVTSAGIRRFRPILLTTLTTFFGLAPMIFETSRQARFMIPMAISLGFGILFSTLITLILVPALYLIIEDVQRLFRYAFGSRGKHHDEHGIGD